ncbi:uncharacterized protein LOC123258514 [Cotesia glomerata]|uniref:F-box domain-containing protein n=1 Tax=Cotesia glomerata TaxID=32391 RepID=A0AAV7HZK0_COTGL|nr:uncharacterized protein LOC123258514 [Cotesia glomerata]KAH0539888.1 hypothetical protein KQX54_009530 [Cotesia glomerata]
MEPFKNFLKVIDALNYNIDFVKIFPTEISQMIFKKLDPRSLLNVAKVSRKWRDVCKSDPQLKKTARGYLRKIKLPLVLTKSNSTFEIRSCQRENGSRSRYFICYLKTSSPKKRKRSVSLDDEQSDSVKRFKKNILKLR